jgi:hypothetical protein
MPPKRPARGRQGSPGAPISLAARHAPIRTQTPCSSSRPCKSRRDEREYAGGGESGDKFDRDFSKRVKTRAPLQFVFLERASGERPFGDPASESSKTTYCFRAFGDSRAGSPAFDAAPPRSAEDDEERALASRSMTRGSTREVLRAQDKSCLIALSHARIISGSKVGQSSASLKALR